MTTISVVIIAILGILVIVEWKREIGNNECIGHEINVDESDTVEIAKQKTYPRLSLLDHDDYEIVPDTDVRTSVYRDADGTLHRVMMPNPVRIRLKRDLGYSPGVYEVSAPLDNRKFVGYLSADRVMITEY